MQGESEPVQSELEPQHGRAEVGRKGRVRKVDCAARGFLTFLFIVFTLWVVSVGEWRYLLAVAWGPLGWVIGRFFYRRGWLRRLRIAAAIWVGTSFLASLMTLGVDNVLSEGLGCVGPTRLVSGERVNWLMLHMPPPALVACMCALMALMMSGTPGGRWPFKTGDRSEAPPRGRGMG
jgi:uncharacterized membrane protein